MAMEHVYVRVHLPDNELEHFKKEVDKEGSKSAYLRRLITDDYENELKEG